MKTFRENVREKNLFSRNQRHSGENDNLNRDSLDGPYDELNKEKDEYADLNGDYIEGVEAEMDYQHPNYATHIYEKTMQV